MKLNNPFAQPDMDMQDIRGDHYGLMNPAVKILRAEGLVCLLLACTLYQVQGFSWLALNAPLFLRTALIWFAHIGLDRALGFGLKFPLGFRVTHLGVLRGMREMA